MDASLVEPVIRVLLRYIAGICLAKGISQGNILTDPNFVQFATYGVALVCSVVSEGWWYLARKRGWAL